MKFNPLVRAREELGVNFCAAEGSICAEFEGEVEGAEELEFGSLLTSKERKRLLKFSY